MVLSLMLLATQSVLPQELQDSGRPLPQDPVEIHPLGDIPLDASTYLRHMRVPPDRAETALPSSYDARSLGIVTPAKNQGSCGSCWAFATVGAMESHLLAAEMPYNPEDLSEQQQVSCNTSCFGCSGGYSSAARYWESKGPQYEQCYPYTAADTPCEEAQCEQLGYRVDNWHTVSATTAAFKDSLYYDGPSYWRYNVYSDFDTYWSTGQPGEVYTSEAGATYRGGHAVLLIGWDDTKQAFLCKNSWGTYGGPNDDGTFWIAYSGHYNGLSFGMSNFDVVSLGCDTDAQCDNGQYCDGAETCVNSVCQNGTPPSCPDDNLWCTGNEFCNEATDSCDFSGNPCDGGTVCNENTDTCELPNCGNGVCDEGENCNNCSSDCISGTAGGTCGACFKGVCDGSCHPRKEDTTCSDCAPGFCCGDGTCSGEEDVSNCAIDCQVSCGSDTECDDGQWCNGAETCSAGSCQAGTPVDCPPGQVCDEGSDSCKDPVDCSACHNGVCDGKCHPVKDGADCPDCSGQNMWEIPSA
jgi:C1A family cysteine protease